MANLSNQRVLRRIGDIVFSKRNYIDRHMITEGTDLAHFRDLIQTNFGVKWVQLTGSECESLDVPIDAVGGGK